MASLHPLLLLILPFLSLCKSEEFYDHKSAVVQPVYYDSHGSYEYVSDGSSDAWTGGRLHQSKCEDIPANMSLCQNIGYTKMRLPNLLDHDTMTEMVQQARPWVPLLGLGCHENTKLFLCSLFSPVCVDRPIYPCRTFCEAVKAGCENRMLKYGYPWPEMLRCDKFPLDNDLCLGPMTGANGDDTVCTACNHPETFEAIVDSFCTADFAIQVRIDDQVVSGSDLKLTVKNKKKKYKANNLSKKELRKLEVYITDGAKCDCPQLTTAGTKEKLIVMGNKRDGKLVITHIFKYDRQSKDTRKAIRAIQKDDTCKKGLGVIGSAEEDKKAKDKKAEDKKAEDKKDGDEIKGDKTEGKTGKENGEKKDRKDRKDRKRNKNGRKKDKNGKKKDENERNGQDETRNEAKVKKEKRNRKNKNNRGRSSQTNGQPIDNNARN